MMVFSMMVLMWFISYWNSLAAQGCRFDLSTNQWTCPSEARLIAPLHSESQPVRETTRRTSINHNSE